MDQVELSEIAINQVELPEIAINHEVFWFLLGLLPLRSFPEKQQAWKWMN